MHDNELDYKLMEYAVKAKQVRNTYLIIAALLNEDKYTEKRPWRR